MARLQEYYKETVIRQLTEQFGYKTVMQVQDYPEYGDWRGGSRQKNNRPRGS